jgi:D-alanyl-D-alanine carboxypeptidase
LAERRTDVLLRRRRASGDVEERLQGLVDRLASRKRVPHALAGVARGDRSFHWVGAAGEARPGVPMRPDTPFFVASVTKLFIAAAVLQQHETGAIGLDEPITRYLPEEVTRGLHRIDGVDHTDRITVRHLLSHTSGLPDFLEDRPERGRSWYEDAAAGNDRSWDAQDVIHRTRGLTAHFPPQDLSGRQRARYSDTGFQLLIMLVQEVTGLPFHTLLSQRFFEPLGMLHTYLPGASEPAEPVDEPAALYVGDRVVELPGVVASCKDLVSTADDTLRFLGALVRGEVFADPATYGSMHARVNRIGYPLRYGLGTMRYRIPAAFAPGRRALTLLGHSGSTGTWLFHCPEMDVLLTGTVDQVDGRTIPFRFMPALLRAITD